MISYLEYNASRDATQNVKILLTIVLHVELYSDCRQLDNLTLVSFLKVIASFFFKVRENSLNSCV